MSSMSSGLWGRSISKSLKPKRAKSPKTPSKIASSIVDCASVASLLRPLLGFCKNLAGWLSSRKYRF